MIAQKLFFGLDAARSWLRAVGPTARCRQLRQAASILGRHEARRYTGSAMSRVVHSDPEILGGTPVFVGTRVPVQSLFDYLEGGDTLDEFVRQFPSVRREQAIAALELARETLLIRARTA